MNIDDLVKELNNGERTTIEIAKEHKLSVRTIQNRIRGAGFTYSQSAKIWVKEDGSEIVNTNTAQKKPKPVTSDMIDLLLNAKPATLKNRTFKGFYYDSDVLDVIDSLPAGTRSDLINEALRQVFKERGRL